MQLTVHLGDLPPLVRHKVLSTLRHEDAAAYAVGVAEQLRLKKLYDQLAVPGFNRNLGRCAAIMSRGQWVAANLLAQKNKTLLSDPDFARWLLKRNEEMRVKDVGTRIQVGYTGKGGRRA